MISTIFPVSSFTKRICSRCSSFRYSFGRDGFCGTTVPSLSSTAPRVLSAAGTKAVVANSTAAHRRSVWVRLPLTLSLSDSETKIFCPLARQRRAPQYKQTRRLLTNRHAQALSARVLFQRTATRQQWVVQRLYNDAVNETVELRLLTVFQHAGAA